ncbi:PCC domain-containing protein [Photobacterium carnosum]|uniref:PCC domain-containing protein n=1 Tax=Photobacterium carnosum TaxID=2023717 RepID=UPI00242F3C7D|nr:DUF296 domain-containing protein [Photobacterium carnosum]
MITPYAKRLLKGDDLHHSLLEFIQLNKIQSGSLLTGVGCLSQAKIRLANEQKILHLDGPLARTATCGCD